MQFRFSFTFLCVCFTALSVSILSPDAVMAQKKRKKKAKNEEKVPVFNYVIDDPMDVFGRQPPPVVNNRSVLLPEFCAGARMVKDTVYRYECYDAGNNLISTDALTDPSGLRYVSLLRSYPDPEHTYKDAAGKPQPLPVSKIINRYDRTGGDKWLSVNYLTNKTTTLQEHLTEIVKTDTVKSTDGSTLLRNYYKVTPVK
jgi:hypothetical protein